MANLGFYCGRTLQSPAAGLWRARPEHTGLVDLQEHQVLPFVRALEGVFYVDQDRVRESVRRRSSFNVIHLGTMLKVDIFVLKDDPASQAEMARREARDNGVRA